MPILPLTTTSTTTNDEKNNNNILRFDDSSINNNNINNNNNNNNNRNGIPTTKNSDKNNKLTSLNLYGIPGNYNLTDDKYNNKLFTIYDPDNEKLSSGLPHSTTGSLSSIITTSVASSEPDPGAEKGGANSKNGKGRDKQTRILRELERQKAREHIVSEPWWQLLLQVSIPFFLAGTGTIGAGIILGNVQNWEVFKDIPQLFILVPALLGLKGNLDMCLASRLSTQANLGQMTSKKEIVRMVFGNIALVQVQAIVASFVVSIFATSVGAAMTGQFSFSHTLLLITASVFTATTSCFVLDFVLVGVILTSKKYKLNPDNVATPLAASIGDVVSISVFSFIASHLYEILDTYVWVLYVILSIYLILLPCWTLFVYRNPYTKPILTTGWVPVLSALFISGLGGLVLNAAVEVYKGFVIFQPIINGIGGNLVSVQASKISTMLHQYSIIGVIPKYTDLFELPWKALFYGVPYAKTAKILILMSIPGQILFVYVADYIHNGISTVHVYFVLSYLLVGIVQVTILLYTAHIIIHFMWKHKTDPDNSAIPYLTALGDLLGSSLLGLAFYVLSSINTDYVPQARE